MGGVVVRTVTAREFNRDVSAAKRAAAGGPVVVTDRGEPAFVLLTFDDYQRMAGGSEPVVVRLAMREEDYVEDVEFEPVGLDVRIPEF